MKKSAMALLLILGVAVAGSVWACEGSKSSHKSSGGTSAPVTPAPAK